MSENLDELKRDYQDIKAPPYLATRIRAQVADIPSRRRGWLPALATVAVAVGALTVTPVLMQQRAADDVQSATSLTVLAKASALKPGTTAPSLSRIRSVDVPAMPSKPKPAPAKDTDSQSHFDLDRSKENDHAYT